MIFQIQKRFFFKNINVEPTFSLSLYSCSQILDDNNFPIHVQVKRVFVNNQLGLLILKDILKLNEIAKSS